MSKVDPVHIMLMENTMRLKNPDKLNYVFDLKGSKVDRKVKGHTKPSTTLKDINFIMAAEANENFTAQTTINRSLLKASVRKDVEFLRNQGLMDYSLLLAIETLDERPVRQATIHQIGAPRLTLQKQTRPLDIDIEQLNVELLKSRGATQSLTIS